MTEYSFPNKFKMALSVTFIILAFALYICWGIAYGSWNIFEPKYIPIYGFMAVFLGFGILGLLLSRME